MTHYALSADALEDLEEIVDFVAADSVQASRRVLGDLLTAMNQLAEMPRLGRPTGPRSSHCRAVRSCTDLQNI